MKHLTPLILALLLFPATVLATNPPKINPYNNIVDASKIKITGTAEPNAKISIVGGAYNIPPITTNADGTFEVAIALTQESKNSFTLTATGKDGKQSSGVTIVITESAEKAKEIEENEGKDVTAPTSPILNFFPKETHQESIVITGRAEPGTFVEAIGPVIKQSEVDYQVGTFSIVLSLTPAQKNKFSVSIKDKANNISPAVIVEISSARSLPQEETPEVASEFTDIKGHWGETYIEQLRLKGIVAGKQEGIFGPDEFITRAALTKIALEATKIEIEKATTAPFDDVPLEQWFTDYIHTAKKYKIVAGFDDGSFKPGDNITRSAGLKILLEAIFARPILEKYPEGYETQTEKLGKFHEDDDFNFPDSKGEWFSKYTHFGKESNIVSGDINGNFMPGEAISRAAVAKIAANVMETAKKAMEKINDLEKTRRDEVRTNDVHNLYEALIDYLDDYKYKNDNALPKIIPSEESIFGDTHFELCEEIVPLFMKELPIDPSGTGFFTYKDCHHFSTGYTILLTKEGKIHVAAPYAETKGIWLESE